MLHRGHLSEALAEFVRMNGILHFCLGQVTQDRLLVAARIKNAVHGLVRRHPQPIDDPQGAKHESIEVAGFDQGHLVERQVAAGEQGLTQRPVLSSRFVEQRGQGVCID